MSSRPPSLTTRTMPETTHLSVDVELLSATMTVTNPVSPSAVPTRQGSKTMIQVSVGYKVAEKEGANIYHIKSSS